MPDAAFLITQLCWMQTIAYMVNGLWFSYTFFFSFVALLLLLCNEGEEAMILILVFLVWTSMWLWDNQEVTLQDGSKKELGLDFLTISSGKRLMTDGRDGPDGWCVTFLFPSYCHEPFLLPMKNNWKPTGNPLETHRKPAGKPHDIHETIHTYGICHDTHV